MARRRRYMRPPGRPGAGPGVTLRRRMGLTEVLVTSLCGIVLFILLQLTLFPFLDAFMYHMAIIPLGAFGQEAMATMTTLAKWIYALVKIFIVLFILYPFVYLWQRHEYQKDWQTESWDYYEY